MSVCVSVCSQLIVISARRESSHTRALQRADDPPVTAEPPPPPPNWTQLLPPELAPPPAHLFQLRFVKSNAIHSVVYLAFVPDWRRTEIGTHAIYHSIYTYLTISISSGSIYGLHYHNISCTCVSPAGCNWEFLIQQVRKCIRFTWNIWMA